MASIEAVPSLVQGSKQVRVIYLVPSDKSIRKDYQDAIAGAISNLQVFYRDQLGSGYAFSIHSPTVEVYKTPHTAAFYSTDYNSRPGGFYESVMTDGFALTGGGYNDPNNRWIFYVDADLICGQYTGGNAGIALLPANDLRGLTNQPTVPICPNDSTYMWGINRWIGGLGHELGHAYNLPHPPGCDSGNCTGGQYAYLSLMYVGYAYYPNTYLLAEDKTKLLAWDFFNVLSLDPLARYEISGHIKDSYNTPLADARVTISETQQSATSDASGNFSFNDLPSGGNYTISVAKVGYRFTPPGVVFNNLDRNQIADFTGTLQNYEITGQVTLAGFGLDGVTITLSGSQSGAATTDASGNYSFTLPAGGNFTLTPSKPGYYFSPSKQTINNLSGSGQIAKFTASHSALQFSAQAFGVREEAGGAPITVKRLGDTSGTVTVKYATGNGTAAANYDYTAVTDTLTFGPGETAKSFTVPILEDALDEANETINLTLSGAGGASLGSPSTAILTITDNDLPPSLSINNVTVTEGNTGTINATFTVKLSAASGQSVSVRYATASGTALAPADYAAVPLTTLTFAPGQMSKPVTVLVKGDLLDEPAETFKVLLSSPVNATIASGQGIGTITDNDLPPNVSINNVTVTEANSGVTNATFTVKLSAASGQTVTVKYATANGTALSPADYTAIALTTLTFAPGQTVKTVTVAVTGDLLDEPNETFKVNLSGPMNATIATSFGAGTCTITDNDAAPGITITDASIVEANAGATYAAFTIKLNAPSANTVMIKYATANGTALAGGDYTALPLTTLTFLPGQTSKTVTVAVKGDTVKEPDETFFLNLSAPVNATITDADKRGVCTILNGTDIALLDMGLSIGQSIEQVAWDIVTRASEPVL